MTHIFTKVVAYALAAIIAAIGVFVVGFLVFSIAFDLSPSVRAWMQQTNRQEFIEDCVRHRHGTAEQCWAAARCDTAADGESEIMCQRRLDVWGQYRDELQAGHRLATHDAP